MSGAGIGGPEVVGHGFTVPVALAVSLVALGPLQGRSARAQVRVGPIDRPVIVRVMVVQAGQTLGRVDPVCADLKRKLRLMNFHSFHLVQQRQFKLRMGEKGRMELPVGHALEFQPISVVDRELHMQVKMPGVVNTSLRMPSNRGVILGGVRYGDGILVVYLKPVFRLPRLRSPAARKKREELHRVRMLRATSAGSGEVPR